MQLCVSQYFKRFADLPLLSANSAHAQTNAINRMPVQITRVFMFSIPANLTPLQNIPFRSVSYRIRPNTKRDWSAAKCMDRIFRFNAGTGAATYALQLSRGLRLTLRRFACKTVNLKFYVSLQRAYISVQKSHKTCIIDSGNTQRMVMFENVLSLYKCFQKQVIY